MTNKTWIIFFIILACIFLLITILVPIILKSNIKRKSKSKSKPNSDNINLWARFPGDLETQLFHSFKFYDYSKINETNSEIPLSDSNIIFKEFINYSIINFDDKNDEIFFNSKKTYNIQSNSKEKYVTTPSMGLFELLESLINQPKYIKGINGIKYLFERAIGNYEIFNKKLFTVYSHDYLMYDEKRLKDIIFSKIKNEETKNKLIYNEEYGFNTTKGYFKWVLLIGNDDLVKNSDWINEQFSLSKDEINSIIGKEEFLSRYLDSFINKLSKELGCDSSKGCGDSLIYYQILNRNVTKVIGIDNISELMKKIGLPLEIDISPEMDIYFDQIYSKKVEGKYNEYSLTEKQLFNIVKGDYSIYSPSNAIYLLNINITKNTTKAYELYSLNEKQLQFITDYIFDFLLNKISYITIKENNKEYTIDENAKTFINFLQILVDNSYGKLIKNNNLLSILRSLIIWKQLEIEIKQNNNLCEDIFQKALDDGKRVLVICQNPKFNLSSIDIVNQWVKPYKCSITGKYDECDMTIYNEINKIIFFNEDDLKKFYDEDIFGKYIISTDKIIKEHYKCKGECSNTYLSKLQYTTCEVTKNPPDIISEKKKDSIKDWDPKNFQVPVELKYYQKNCGNDCNEKSNGAILSLYNTTKNILQIENFEAYNNKILLESIYTLYINKITSSDLGKKLDISNSENFFNTFQEMIKSQIFNDTIYQNYSTTLNIIYGNSKEDKMYMKFLSNGDYSEGFKPNKNKTTGFNFYFYSKLYSNDIKYDDFTIQTNQIDKSQILRKIVKMNSFPIFNIKKEEYDLITNQYIQIGAPLYNYYDIEKGDIWFSDGYQYESDLETIYYYDELSSRILEFKYKGIKTYNDTIECNNYIMSNQNISLNINEERDINYNLNETFGLVSQKFNKPFVISSLDNEEIKKKIKIDNEQIENNNICVDPLSNMVLESNLTLVYSIYTKNFGNIFTRLKNNDFYPIILYNRKYNVSIDSYDKVFPGIISYYNWRLFIIIFGLILTAIFIGLSVLFYLRYHNDIRNSDAFDGKINENLFPSSFERDE